VEEQSVQLTAPQYVFSYVTGFSESNDFIVAGTTYKRSTVTVGEKKADGIFYFSSKFNATSTSDLSSPVENLIARKLLMNGNTIYLAAEQFKEEKIDPPASAAGTAAAFDYHYNLIHGGEYVIGLNQDGSKKFELNIGKKFSIRDIDHQYVSAYFICNGNFNIIYNDERQKYTVDSGYNYLIPALVQITNDGLMLPAVPFTEKLKLPYDHVPYTSKYVQLSDNQINLLLNKGERSRILQVKIQ
jgi:hypothetical protein